MNQRLQALYGLKFHPFRPDVPIEALHLTPSVDSFPRRVELGVTDGGFVSITGDPGTGKSVALRLLAHRLRRLPNVTVGVIEHPQSRTSDFYRELGDLFGVALQAHTTAGAASRPSGTAGASTSRRRSCAPCSSSTRRRRRRPPSSTRSACWPARSSTPASCSASCSRDSRLPERFRAPELLPLGSRIRRRLVLEYAARDELAACLEHLLEAAGNPALMTQGLKDTLVDHAAGNYRVLMNLSDELLAVAVDREVAILDEKLYFDAFAQPAKPKPVPKKRPA